MQSERVGKIPGVLRACCFSAILFFSINSSAHANFVFGGWRPFITVGGGIAVSGDIGKNTSFPDPLLGGLDVYKAKDEILSAGAVDGFLGVELDFAPIAFQIGLGYNQTSSFSVDNTGIQGQDTSDEVGFTYQYKIVARQYLAEGKFLFNLCGCLHPYILLGAGASQNGIYSYQTDIPDVIRPQYTDQTSSSFSYIGGVGFDYAVLPDVRLGLGYRFTDFGRLQLDIPLASTSAVGTLSQSHFYVHELLVYFTFI